MNIVHTEASCGWGGQEIRILLEARGMIDRGHCVSILAPLESRIFLEASHFGVPTIPLSIQRKTFAGLVALRKLLARLPVDVINTHSSTDSWLAALATASLKKTLPIVRTRHISTKVRNTQPNRWLYRHASRFVVTTGESLRQALITDLNLNPARVVSIPTGVDTRIFHPSTAVQRCAARKMIGANEMCFVIGIIATLRDWKGHRNLIEAFADRFHTPTNNAKLIIVGDGPQRSALEALVVDLKLSGKVLFTGNQTDVLPWLHSFDAFALPSYANEGIPQAILQAMAGGVPVVTTDVGAIGELAINDRTALVVRKQNSSELAAALLRIREDSVLRERITSNALNLVDNHHRMETMLQKMEAVFSAATSGNSFLQ